MTIFDRVKALDLPLGQYVINGGVMEAHGIRPARDVDIIVDKELFRELKRRGWRRKWFFRRMFTCRVLVKGDAEAWSSFRHGSYQLGPEEQIKKAQTIQGLPFLPLEDLMMFKSQLARPKDLKDAELIKNYLEKKLT